MNTRRIFTALFFTFLFIAGASDLNAQTPKKAKTTKSKTTKTTSKKAVAKTPKAATKTSSDVIICDGGYFFHRRNSCEILKKCKGRILTVTKQNAMDQYSCKQCKKCY